MSGLDDLDARMTALDERLRPIAQRPVDITRPGWLERLQRAPLPMDEANVRDTAERLLDDLISSYEHGEDETREAIRRLFAGHRSFAWAAALPDPRTSGAGARRHLIVFSMKDQGRDSRDALLTLQEICRDAAAAGVALGPLLEEVAAMSSRADRFGMGSTRDMLLGQRPER